MAKIDWNNVLPQESGRALASAAACLVVLIGAGWALFSFGYARGKDIGQDELAAYKAASEAKLPDVTSGLLSVSKELRDNFKVFDRNKTLETENASYQKQLAEASKARADLEVRLKELQDNLKDSTTREDRLRDQLAKFAGSGRRFSMSQNQTEMLGNGHIIGVNAVYSTWLNVTFDNKEREMKAGSYISVDVPDKAFNDRRIGANLIGLVKPNECPLQLRSNRVLSRMSNWQYYGRIKSGHQAEGRGSG